MLGDLFHTPNKQLKAKWYFPSGRNLEKTSASNAYVETFSDHKLKSLAREICQNSLDATDGSKKPVKVSFQLMEIETDQLPGYREFIEVIIPNAEKTWSDEQKTQRLLTRMKQTFAQKTLHILKISDENTTGLEPQNWASLIEQAGSSVKANHDSGGSFGIGKSAPFAVSDLRMVFYNTSASEKTNQSIGVSKFVSYDLKNGETVQGTGYCGEKEKKPFSHSPKFDGAIRTKRGTDVYIIGFNLNDFPQWKTEIIYSVLDNFLISILKNQLEVSVCEQQVTAMTIEKYIAEITSSMKLLREYSDLVSYYGVLADNDHVVIPMPSFEPYNIGSGEATLILSNKTENNRRVLMSRKAGMKIFDKKSISGILKFSGVFQATGVNINTVLKELENPNHDKWSVDRAVNKTTAKKFLEAINRFIKESVIDQYQEKITEEIDAFGVSDFLPLNIDTLKNKAKTDENKFNSKNVKIILKTPTTQDVNTAIIRSNEPGEISEDITSRGAIPEGDLDSTEFDGSEFLTGSTSGKEQGTDTSTDRTPSFPSDTAANLTENQNIPVADKTHRKKVMNIKYRVIEINAKEGRYRIVLNPQYALTNILLSIAIVGDSGNKSKVKVRAATDADLNSLKISGQAVYVNNLAKTKWQHIEVKINQQKRLKLEVEAYANFK